MNSKTNEFCNRLDGGVDDVRKLSKEFCERLGLTAFAYVRVYHDGRVGWVTSDSDHDRMLVEENVINYDPFVDTADGLKAGSYLWFNDQVFPGSDVFHKNRAEMFGLDHGMVLVKHHKTYLETGCFSGLQSKKPLHNLFMNEKHLFNLFFEHFKKEMSPKLKKLIDEGLMLCDLKSTYGKPSFDELSSEDRKALIAVCGWDKLLLLSKREKECLCLLTNGLTYHMIGNSLGLSERTVEHYLNAVKNKLGLESKFELHQVAEKLNEIGGL